MKKVLTVVFTVLAPLLGYSQNQLISISYGYDYALDTTGVGISIDLNRKLAAKETEGIYWVYKNLPRGSYKEGESCLSNWFLTLRPTIDANLGSSTSLAPNNISIGLPVSLGYDFEKFGFINRNGADNHTFLFQLEPKFISDRDFENALYVVEPGAFWNVTINRTGVDRTVGPVGVKAIDFTVGVKQAFGQRRIYKEVADVPGSAKGHDYSRLSIPFQLEVVGLLTREKTKSPGKRQSSCEEAKLRTAGAAPESKDDNAVDQTTESGKPYYRLHWKTEYQLNNVFNDFDEIEHPKGYEFFSSKITYFLNAKTGVFIDFQKGKLEPLFKNTHSLKFGLSITY